MKLEKRDRKEIVRFLDESMFDNSFSRKAGISMSSSSIIIGCLTKLDQLIYFSYSVTNDLIDRY